MLKEPVSDIALAVVVSLKAFDPTARLEKRTSGVFTQDDKTMPAS
jgi:hypothetical protein